jgi:small subunit ribosomal protein S20
MPNIKSSKKDVLRSATRQLRNKSAKSAVKTAIKKSRVAVAAGATEEAIKRVHDTQALINKTASRGIIHKNAAARRTSRLMKRLAAAQKAAA